MHRKLRVLALVATCALAVGAWAAFADAESRRSTHAQVLANDLTIAAVFTNGGPSSPLTVQRACTGGGGTVTFSFSAPGTVNTSDIGTANSCEVTATVTDGATSVTFACSATGNMVCGNVATNDLVVTGPAPTGGTATITVTFDFTPAPVVAAPQFTG